MADGVEVIHNGRGWRILIQVGEKQLLLQRQAAENLVQRLYSAIQRLSDKERS